jgi:hypothetical protein
MNGFGVTDSLDDPSGSIVITFWETEKDMASFYKQITERCQSWLKNANPSSNNYQKERIINYQTLGSDCLVS